MQVTIRPIQESDYAAVSAIWRDVLDIYNATEQSVAETDGKVAGLVTVVKVLAIGHPGGYIKMNGLGVLPEYRRLGIGKMLMDRVEQLALQEGAPYIGLASGIRRTEAHAFYERLGFQKTSFWFRKNLE